MGRRVHGGRRALALLAVVGLLATACAGGDDGDAAAESEGNGEETGDAGDGEPQQGGTFVYGAFGEIAGLDPIVNSGSASQGGIPGMALYDTLMRLDDAGEPEPYLAESLEPDEAGQVWTLRLREGVTFHDGTSLNAEAVAFNLQRHLDPENRSAYLADLSMIEDLTVTDDLELEISLRAPWAALPAILADVPGMIASPTAIEEHGEDFNQQPVGAGPFMFESWTPDDELRLVRNPDYWQEGLPYLDEWVHKPMPDEGQRLTSVQSGELDAAYSLVLSSEMQAAADDPEVEIDTFIGNGGNAITLNTQQPPLDDVRVRQAMAHLIDYDAINQVRYQGQLPDQVGVFGPESPYYSGTEYPRTDPERAQELLDEYRADTGQETVSLTLGAIPDRRSYVEMLQEMLAGHGIEAEIEMLDVSEFVPKVIGGDYDAAVWSMTHFADPDLGLFSSFHSESPQNAPQFQNEEMDAALEQGRSTLDVEARREAYAEVDRILAEEVPYLFTNPSVQSLIMGSDVRGLEPYDDRQFLSSEIWLDG